MQSINREKEKYSKKNLPPHITTGKEGSFAFKTITERKPAIIDQVIKTNKLSDKIKLRLKKFKIEIEKSVITDPFAKNEKEEIDLSLFKSEELASWKDEIHKYIGKTWLEIPWYFAEAYFYLRLLIAYGYYSTVESELSCNRLHDPFERMKNKETISTHGGLHITQEATYIMRRGFYRSITLESLILLSLWGNRIDLSNFQIAENSKYETIKKNEKFLIINHVEALMEKLFEAREIHFILDNAGQELVADLMLSLFIFTSSKNISGIILHVKESPFFVSDTMKKDIKFTVDMLKNCRNKNIARTGKTLEELIYKQKIKIEDHYFWNGPKHFIDLPHELRNQLKSADIVVIKGDANYRRLLSDRHWAYDISLREITSYFPANFVVLRTMKSELIVNITEEEFHRYTSEDPEWLINGKRGIIQLVFF